MTGKRLCINGVSQVPAGLFGIHAMPMDESLRELGIGCVREILPMPGGCPIEPPPSVAAAGALLMECFFDRFVPALTLTNPGGWDAHLAGLGESYGRAARMSSRDCCIEFWNEPFLNWAIKPGVNYDPIHYDTYNINPGARVRVKGEESFTEYLVWGRREWVVRDDNLATDHIAASYRPPGLAVGGRYDWRGRRYRVVERWLPEDPTQTHAFSGQQNRIWYERMLRAFGEALKRANPEVRLLGGWGCEPHRDGWAAWYQLYKPLIDSQHDLIDGIVEHHYGGDTRELAAIYETVTAYMDTRHAVRLPFYNTEAGGYLSPDSPDCAGPIAEEDDPRASRHAMSYMLRDLICAIDVCPDKVITRCAHEVHQSSGPGLVYRLLSGLRGDLILCKSPYPDIWCVASRLNNKLTVVVYNDSDTTQRIPLVVEYPDHTRVKSATRLTVRENDDGELALHRCTLPDGEASVSTISIEALNAVVHVYELAGGDSPAPGVRIEQFFAGGVHQSLGPGRPLSLQLVLPASRLRAAHSARLKLALPAVRTDVTITINGNVMPLAPGSWVIRQSVPLDWLSEANDLVFDCGEECSIWMVSIELIESDSLVARLSV